MTATVTTLVSFNDYNGFFPQASLIADANGDLFGTTIEGGAYTTPERGPGPGEVFEIVNTGTAAAPVYASTPTLLVSFNFTNGSFPEGSLLADPKGDLFGTTSGGGAYGHGTVFEIVNTGNAAAPIYASTPTILVSFTGIDSSGPTGSLITDAHGDLFGTASGYGVGNNFGTVFEIVNTGNTAAPIYASTPTTLVSFNGTNGADPAGSLITDAHGNFFGTTNLGGVNNFGTVFEIVNTGTTAAPIYASTPTTLEPISKLRVIADGL